VVVRNPEMEKKIFVQKIKNTRDVGIIAGLIQWYPLFTGLVLNPKLLKVQFTVMFVGISKLSCF
jgi:hypothetical protein